MFHIYCEARDEALVSVVRVDLDKCALMVQKYLVWRRCGLRLISSMLSAGISSSGVSLQHVDSAIQLNVLDRKGLVRRQIMVRGLRKSNITNVLR